MSLHPSLVSQGKTRTQRTVLKRIERIKYLMEKNLWRQGDKVTGLAKIKILRIKIKKEKTKAAAPAAEAASAAAKPAAEAASAAAKPAAGAKK